MSFGLSSGGGQVRYAVVFDSTQAEQNVKRLSTTLQQLGTGSAAVSGKMAIMNNTFTAGLTPIKNQGNALNQLATTQKTIGSQLGGLGSAFKSNALAIGAAASSVLGLYQNYANLSSAQNAANKSATAAKAAQNSVATATKALSTAIDKYGKGSKEAKAAQDKLTVAQERAVNKTESAKIAQDNLNQTMADFGINILPNVILAGGSIVSIFDNIGKSGSGVTGIVSKLGGVFGGLGGGIKSTVIPAIAGLMGTGGLGGLTDKLKSASTSATGFWGSITGVGLAGGIGIAGAAIIIQQVQQIQDSFDAAGIKFEKMKHGMIFSPKEAQLGMDQMDELLRATGMSIKDITEDMDAAKKKFVEAGGKISATGDIIWGSFDKSVEAGKKFIDLGPGFTATGADYVKWSTKMLDSGKSEVDVMNFLLGSHIKLIDAIKIEGAAMENHNKIVAQKNTLTQAELNIISRRNEAMATAREQDIADAAAIGEVIKVTTAAADGAKRMAEELKLENDAMKNILPNIVKLGENSAKSAEATKLVGDMVKLAKDRMVEWTSVIDPVAAALKDLTKITIDATAATVAGIEKFGSFIKTTAEGAITNKVYTDSLRSWVSQQIAINPALDLTTSQLESLQQALAKGKVDLAGMSEATQILADAMNNELAPSMKTFESAINADKWKDFKKSLKDLPGFGDFAKGARKELTNLLGDMRNVAKAAKEVGTDISAAVLGAFEGLSGKSLGSFVKELNKDIKSIAKIDIDATKFKPIQDFLNSLTDKNRAAGILKIKDSLGLMQDAMADGNITAEEAAAVIAKFNEETGKTADPVGKSAAAIKAFGVSSAAARGQIDQVTGAIDVLASQAQNIKPTIIVNNSKALQAIGVIAKHIQDLDKLKPILQVQNSKAIKAVDVIAKRIDDLAKIKPTLQVQNSKALKAVDVIANRIQDLSKIHPTITVNTDKALNQIDSIVRRIQNIPSVKVDSGGTGSKTDSGTSSSLFVGGSKSDSGGGGGDTVINIHVMDETIMRRITARSGRGRFTMGA